MPVVPVVQTPLLSYQQAVPELAGAQAGTQIAHGILQNVAQAARNRFLPAALQEQLKQEQLKTQYYPQVTEAEIQQKLATGELTRGQAAELRQKMQYYPAITQADIISKLAQARKAGQPDLKDPVLRRISEYAKTMGIPLQTALHAALGGGQLPPQTGQPQVGQPQVGQPQVGQPQ
jgi:hypothetical protein